MGATNNTRHPQPVTEVEVVLPDGTRIIRRSFGPVVVPWPGQGGGWRDCGCPIEGYVCGSVACPRAVRVWC